MRSKLILFILLLHFVTLAGHAADVTVKANPKDYMVLIDFGEWIEVPVYGMVWKPTVDSDWRPFYYGEWAWTDRGWMWVSYEPVDAMVYEYGNWIYDGRQGWVWVPGYEWSPARVSWITFDKYVGWTPLPVKGARRIDPWQQTTAPLWTVVDVHDFLKENVGGLELKSTLRKVGGDVSHRAPQPAAIEKATGQPVQKMEVIVSKERLGNLTINRSQLLSEKERIEAHRKQNQKFHKTQNKP
jgi:hypothetical protein